MRNIRTSENFVEFLELNNDGQIINSKGFQFGELYFEIKNKKVTFFLNDPSKPFGSMVWSIDIPFELDGVVYEDEDTASSALHNIMNDRFQEQLDQLKEDLAAEEARAQEAEAQLDDKIDDESARAIAAENRLQDQVTELSGAVAVLDNRVTNVENDLSALTDTVNDEITRSTAKDAEHDAQISGLTNTLNSEIQRALAAESGITANLNSEISRSTEKDAQHDTQISALTVSLDNEINRATSAENSLRNDLNAEVSRATDAEEDLDDKIDLEIHNRVDAISGLTERVADDEASTSAALVDLNDKVNALSGENASQNVQISGLNNSINTEISRATSVENALRSDLTNETSARTNADAAMLERIVAVEVGKADANSVYTKAETDNKYATKDYISGLTDEFQEKLVAGENITIVGNVISATGGGGGGVTSGQVQTMIDESISGKADSDDVYTKNEVYTKAEVDEAIDDIDLSDYYTKSEVDASQLAQDNKINAISGDVQTLNGKVETISGESVTSGEVESMIDEAVSGKQDSISAGRAIDITNNVVSFTLPISAGTGSNSIIEGYKTKTGILSSYSHAEGYGSSTVGNYSHAEGSTTTANGNYSHAEGYSSTTVGDYSHSEGIMAKATGDFSHAEGSQTEAGSVGSHAEGRFTTAATPYSFVCGLNGKTSGDSTLVEDTNTIFAIGNGLDDTHKTTRVHNAFEVKLNGDIYISSGGTRQSPMIKLQDYLGGGGSEPVDAYTKAESDAKFATITNFNSHSGNTTMHVTSAEKATWNAKADASSVYNKTEIDNKLSAKPNVWCGNESEWSQISGSTESGTIYLVY